MLIAAVMLGQAKDLTRPEKGWWVIILCGFVTTGNPFHITQSHLIVNIAILICAALI